MTGPICLDGLSAETIFDDNAHELKLIWFTGHEGADRTFKPDFVTTASSSADLVGHLNLIHPHRIQVLGRPELEYLNRLNENDKRRHMTSLVRLEPPLVILADSCSPPEDLALYCTRSSTPLITTKNSAATVIDHLRNYISRMGAPRCTKHGVFLDILGMGVLIMGESGLGKSELGLELISRGHGLVADDAVEFTRLGHDFIEGRCPPLIQNLLEVRGLGLLDIGTIFGETAVRRKMKLKLIVRLTRRDDGSFERLPFEAQHEDVLGLPVRIVKIQVAAGRNLAVLVEAAVRNTILQLRGINTLEQFMAKQRAMMQSGNC
jgi:HPr kinase/phosphorylase